MGRSCPHRNHIPLGCAALFVLFLAVQLVIGLWISCHWAAGRIAAWLA